MVFYNDTKYFECNFHFDAKNFVQFKILIIFVLLNVECYLCRNTCEKVYETFLLLNVVISLTFFLCCNGFLIASFDRLSLLLKHFLFPISFYSHKEHITKDLKNKKYH